MFVASLEKKHLKIEFTIYKYGEDSSKLLRLEDI